MPMQVTEVDVAFVAADTKKNRRRVIEHFRAKHGNKRVALALLQREHISECWRRSRGHPPSGTG